MKKQVYRIAALMMAALFLCLCPLENVLAEGAAEPVVIDREKILEVEVATELR